MVGRAAALVFAGVVAAGCQLPLLFRSEDDPRPKTCGNNVIDQVEELACPSCVADSQCPCVTVTKPADACDGSDLGGRSCESLGYFGGELSCDRMCSLETRSCRRVRSGAEVRAPSGVPQGRFAAVAAGGAVVAVAASNSTELVFQRFDARTLLPLGKPTRRETWMAADGTNSFGELVIAAMGDAFIVAVHRYGGDTPTEVYRVSSAGEWSAPTLTVPRSHPTSVVVGTDRVLLVLERYLEHWPIDVVVLDPEGAPLSEVRRAVDHRWPYSENQAAGAAIDGGFVLVATPNGQFASASMHWVRLDPAGRPLSASEPLPWMGNRAALAVRDDGTLSVTSVYADALSHSEVPAVYSTGSGDPSAWTNARTRSVGRGAFIGPMVSAVRGGTLHSWIAARGSIVHAELGAEGAGQRVEPIVMLPNLETRGFALAADATYALIVEARKFELLKL